MSGRVMFAAIKGKLGTRVVEYIEVRCAAGCVRASWFAGDVKRRKMKNEIGD